MATPGRHSCVSWALIATLVVGCGLVTSAAQPTTPPPLAEATKLRSQPVGEKDRPTPMDPAVRTGKLANGLTYYVLKHEKSEQRAALWLAVNAGSVLEDDDQRGLAHLVEHMAFNGTRRFPRGDIQDFMGKAGMTMGADLNAYTGFDQTVYQLTVPTDDLSVMYQGLDILRDMAGDMTLDAAAVDKERGVVIEEWRRQRGAAARIRDQQVPILFHGSRYAQRLPIGLPDIIKAAKPETLARFYQDWYRPELMAVIAVGDFDPGKMEAEIKTRFGDLSNRANPRPRAEFSVPHEQDLAVAIATDAETRFTTVTVSDKIDHRPDETKSDYRRNLIELLYHEMWGARLSGQVNQPNSPLVSAIERRGKLTRTTDASTLVVAAKEGQLEGALQLLFREIARLERYGFLPSEIESARKKLVVRIERSARERDKAPLRDLASEMVRNFVDHDQMPGPDVQLAWVHELAPGITLEELNRLAKVRGGDKGRVIVIGAPASAKMPAETKVRAIVKAALEGPLRPWRDVTFDAPLIATPPTPGKVVSSEHDLAADATVWTLANGVRIVVKPTAFLNDSVSVKGWQSGGTSVVPDVDFVHARFAGEIIGQSGAAGFSEARLRKLLAGKIVSVSVGLSERREQVDANARPEDLETMLQLLHLKLTEPRRDRMAFETWKGKGLESARHRDDSPEQRFADEVVLIATGHHSRRRPVTTEMIEQVDLDRAYAIWKDRFDDFSGFTFVFVGNIDLPRLQQLVETYIGSLPSKAKHEHWRDIGIEHPKGKTERTIVAGSEPKSVVWIDFNDSATWSRDAERDARILRMVLAIRLREVLRQDMNGVYNVNVAAAVNREPTPRRTLKVAFGCAPENVDKLRDAVFAELAALAKNGIGDATLAMVVQQLRRQHEVDVKNNRWWLKRLSDAYYFSEDFAQANDVDPIIKRVTSENVRATARRMFDDKEYILAVLRPASPSRDASPKTAPPDDAASDESGDEPPP